jgi:hypothetical protein
MESLTLRMDGVGSLGRPGVEGVGGLRRSWVAGVWAGRESERWERERGDAYRAVVDGVDSAADVRERERESRVRERKILLRNLQKKIGRTARVCAVLWNFSDVLNPTRH